VDESCQHGITKENNVLVENLKSKQKRRKIGKGTRHRRDGWLSPNKRDLAGHIVFPIKCVYMCYFYFNRH
jgi:hypothetical protein